MKFLIVLFCISYVSSTSYAALSSKYYRDNAQNYFFPYYEPLRFDSYSGKTNNVEGIGKLTTSLLHDIYIRAGKNFNIAVSPVSIWSILAMLLEGASGKTENELKAKLQLTYSNRDQGKQTLRNQLKEMLNLNSGRSNSPTEFTSINFVVTDKSKMINPEYKNIVRQYYNGQHFDADSANSEEFSRMINTWASQVTNNRISNLISPAVLNNLILVIGNAVYFKSQWKYPFDPSQTILMPFKNEFDRPITKVPMMNQVLVLPYVYNTRLESEVVEIPYADNLTSMIVILPREGVSLMSVLSRMKYINIEDIIPKNSTEETIQLIMPKFHIVNKIYLNDVLKQDLRTVFSQQLAEFPLIGKNIFVSKISHKTEIENTEEGTTASAVSVAQFAYKSSSLNFRADRPFIYLINQIKTRTILFAGTYSNPFAA